MLGNEPNSLCLTPHFKEVHNHSSKSQQSHNHQNTMCIHIMPTVERHNKEKTLNLYQGPQHILHYTDILLCEVFNIDTRFEKAQHRKES